MSQAPAPLFVAGFPQAGTTRLTGSLNTHPGLHISPECRFLQQFFNRGVSPTDPLDAEAAQLFTQLVGGDEKLAAWPNFDPATWLETTPLEGRWPAEVLHDLFQASAAAHGAGPDAVVGHSKGFYASGFGSTMREVFPGARFLFLLRDPRDVVCANRDHFDETVTPLCHDIMFRFGNMRELRAAAPEHVRLMRYHDLVHEPARTLGEVISWLGLPPSESLRLVETPFPFDASGMWRQAGLPPEALDLIESITTPLLDAQGYAPWRDEPDQD